MQQDGGVKPLFSSDVIGKLRAAVEKAGYTAEGVAAVLGPEASAALGRGDLLPAQRATNGGTPLETLIRLFICGGMLSTPAVQDALDPLRVDQALSIGLVEPARGGLRAAMDLRPYGDDDGDWWVLSDLGTDVRPGPLAPDHVLGIGGAALTLASATVRQPVRSALDIGIGCGIQALHLSRHSETVTGTDISQRALAMAATTAALNGLDWELVAGDLTEPVADRRFDLVVTNPPFVIGTGDATHSYRDSGRSGDAVVAEVLATAPALLNDGGWLQLLGNWLHLGEQEWTERVAGWLPDHCDAWVVQREVLDPAEYVAMWLRDAGQDSAEHAHRASTWLDWFAAHDVRGVGFGLISVRASNVDSPSQVVEDLRQQTDHPLGIQVGEFFGRQLAIRRTGLLDLHLVAAPELRLRQEASRGKDGWEVEDQLLTGGGLRATHAVDPLVVALVAGCDGTLSLRDQLTVLAHAYDTEPASLHAAAELVVGPLVRHGLLLP
jgi:methylase of polypeptide subunit release factors